jgi:hypothetical protein
MLADAPAALVAGADLRDPLPVIRDGALGLMAEPHRSLEGATPRVNDSRPAPCGRHTEAVLAHSSEASNVPRTDSKRHLRSSCESLRTQTVILVRVPHVRTGRAAFEYVTVPYDGLAQAAAGVRPIVNRNHDVIS